jgi:hypothetical protein
MGLLNVPTQKGIMGRDVLAHGESVDITFSRSEKSCMWDLKIKDEDGDHQPVIILPS